MTVKTLKTKYGTFSYNDDDTISSDNIALNEWLKIALNEPVFCADNKVYITKDNIELFFDKFIPRVFRIVP